MNRIGTALAIVGMTIGAGALLYGQGARMGDAVLRTAQHDPAKELAMKINAPFTFAAVGDIAIQRPISEINDPRFQALFSVMRAADMTYANMEGPLEDDKLVKDLTGMGIRIMTTANNHTMDDGVEGMFHTMRLLDDAGIANAGTGKDLEDARSARVTVTPKGVVGIVGMYSIDPASSPPESKYTDARPNWPGLNPLRVTPYNIVSAEHMKALKAIRDDVYAHRPEVRVPVAPVAKNEPADEVSLFGSFYKVGEKVGSISYSFNVAERVASVRGGGPNDLEGILQSIRAGKQTTDFMVVAIHCHQNSFAYQAYSHDNHVPDFLVELAHKSIDAGADVFVGHGVHTIRGIEIYKGKPVFYGVGNFLFPQGAVGVITNGRQDPAAVASQTGQPENREALLTTSRYDGGKLVEVRIYPADLGLDFDRTISRAGLPMTPSPANAHKILKVVQDASKAFGTAISIEDNVGVIRVPKS
jgi:poly-gamma-glutamate capsule biosynthesis protein CapA/YwtB (metallophosphatase superfamily)